MIAFASIFRFELRAALRERTLPLLFAVYALALGYAVWNGHRWTAERAEALNHVQRDIAEAHAQTLARFRDSEARDPARSIPPSALAAGIWYRPALPLAPLAFVTVGQADRFPFETRFHPTNVRAVFAPRPVSIDHPGERAAGRFDVAFVLVTVLPVLLLAASFDAWTRDRESGVARLLLAQPVGARKFVSAKILARAGILLAASMALSLVALPVAAKLGGFPIDWVGLAVMQTALLAYGLFWLGVAAVFNLAVTGAAASAVAVGAVWMLVVGLAPAGLAALVDVLRPLPDMGALVNTLRLEELAQQEADEREAAQARAAGTRATGLEATLARAERQRARAAELRKPFETKSEARLNLAEKLRLVVPAVALQDTFERLAGHDARRALSFQRQVWGYVDELHDYIRQPAAVPPATLLDDRYAALPRFAFVEPAGVRRQGPMLANLIALLGMSAASCLAAGMLLRRSSKGGAL